MDSHARRIALLALLALAVTAAPAGAATVTSDDADGYNTLTYAANPGEANDLTIEPVGGLLDDRSGWLVADSGAPLTAAGACEQVSANQALCDVADPELSPFFEFARADLGDGNDRASVSGADGFFNLSVTGGEGDDDVFAGQAFVVTRLHGLAGDDTLEIENAPLQDALLGNDDDRNPDGEVFGGDGDDRLEGGRDALHDGGAGDDVIDVRNLRLNVVTCGDGLDAVRADDERRDDVWAGCEQVDRPLVALP